MVIVDEDIMWSQISKLNKNVPMEDSFSDQNQKPITYLSQHPMSCCLNYSVSWLVF